MLLPSPFLGPLSLKQDSINSVIGQLCWIPELKSHKDPELEETGELSTLPLIDVSYHCNTKAKRPSLFLNLLIKKILFLLSLCSTISVAIVIPHPEHMKRNKIEWPGRHISTRPWVLCGVTWQVLQEVNTCSSGKDSQDACCLSWPLWTMNEISQMDKWKRRAF